MPINEVQRVSGSFSGTSVTTDPLPAVTTAGNRVVICASSPQTVNTPSGFTKRSYSGLTAAGIFDKATTGGETAWTISLGATGPCRYDIFEFEGTDPDYPVDVASTATGDATTGTIATSTTYDGKAIALHLVAETTLTTTHSFSGQTGGFEEQTDAAVAAASSSVSQAVSWCDVQSLAQWSSTATATPSGGTARAQMVVYTAQGARRDPVVSHFWSFPAELAGITSLNLGPALSRYFESLTGSPVILAGGGLQLTGSASAQNVVGPSLTLPTVGPAHIANIKFRLNSVSGDLLLGLLQDSVGGAHTQITYISASQKIAVQVAVAGSSQVLSDATVTTGQDYSIDLRTTGPSTSRVTDWKLDYGSGPVDQTQVTTTGVAGGLGNLTPRLGWTATSTGTVTYWHAVYSTVAGHYPLTNNWVFPFLKPDTAGTITARSGTTADLHRFTANGTIDGSFNSANIITALRDWPPVFGASADGAAIIAASTGTYTIPMETYDASGTGSIRTVMVLGAMWAASATAATHQLNAHDGSASTTLLAMADQNADTSSTPPWLAKLWRPSGGWTQAKLDAATLDLLSDDATPDVGWHCLGIIAAVRLAETQTLFGTMASQTRDPVTGGILAATVTPPVGYDTTLHYEDPTATDVSVTGGSTHTEVIDAPDAPTVNYIAAYPAAEPDPSA